MLFNFILFHVVMDMPSSNEFFGSLHSNSDPYTIFFVILGPVPCLIAQQKDRQE